jgi:hypothetical protein
LAVGALLGQGLVHIRDGQQPRGLWLDGGGRAPVIPGSVNAFVMHPGQLGEWGEHLRAGKQPLAVIRV